MANKLIQANSSHQFSLERFCIAAELLGAVHTFTRAGKQITVILPLAQEGSSPQRENSSVWCYAWRTEGNVPLEYQVNRISLRVAVGDKLSVPEEALKVPPRRDELFTNSEREQFERLIDDLSDTAVDAFQYWLAILRWKSEIGHIGEPGVRLSGHSAGGSALQDSATGHRFWLQTQKLVVPASKVVTLSKWHSAQEAMNESKNPPVWFTFVFEGEQRINNHDLTGAALSLAIALEVIVRTLVTHHLATQAVEQLIRKVVDLANLRYILSRLRSLSFWNSAWDAVVDFSEFNRLMDYRDRIMHSADTKDLTVQDLRKLHVKVKSLAYFVSTFLEKE